MGCLSWKESFQISIKLALSATPASNLHCWVGSWRNSEKASLCFPHGALVEDAAQRQSRVRPPVFLRLSPRAARPWPSPPRPSHRVLSFPREWKVKLSGAPVKEFCARGGAPAQVSPATTAGAATRSLCIFFHLRCLLRVQYVHFVDDSKKTCFFLWHFKIPVIRMPLTNGLVFCSRRGSIFFPFLML